MEFPIGKFARQMASLTLKGPIATNRTEQNKKLGTCNKKLRISNRN